MAAETVIAAYLAASLALGALFKRKADTIRGFLVANREVADWLLAFTFGATYFSSVVIVVGGAWAYIWGPLTLLIPFMNVLLGTFLAFALLGSRVCRLSVERDALTVPELLGKLYGSRGLQRLYGIVTAVSLALYASVVISGVAAMMAPLLHMDMWLVALTISVVMAVYVALGGMYSVVWTDVIQGVIMAGGVAALTAILLPRNGLAALESIKPLKHPDLLLILDLALLTSLAVWGLPQLINRFYTVERPSIVRRAAGVATLFAFIVSFGSFINGLEAHHVLGGIEEPLKVIPLLTYKVLGYAGGAVFAAAVLAAAMSTVDSIALTAGAAISYDLMGRRETRPARLASIIFTVTAALVASAILALPRSVAHAVTTVFKTGWSIAAGAFLAPVLFAILGKASRKAAIASTAAGVTTASLLGVAKALRLQLPTLVYNMSFTLTVLAALTAYILAYLATGSKT